MAERESEYVWTSENENEQINWARIVRMAEKLLFSLVENSKMSNEIMDYSNFFAYFSIIFPAGTFHTLSVADEVALHIRRGRWLTPHFVCLAR